MAAKYRHGQTLKIDRTPSTAKTAGEVEFISSQSYVWAGDTPANVQNAVHAPAGTAVFELPKAGGGGVTFAVGAVVQFDGTNAVATGGTHFGYAVADAADADTMVWATLDKLHS